ncbi:MAG: hypothetical protein SO360_01705 [Bifidobacterium tsurumiense]|uniref:hypothetical protein n=1 Tax=Bifidobacterium tsurumiense TaxID=356829 RepID=UPI002A81079F|nr:hypothetical protein [Bifidobacterium tsurumiense]MDY4677567.1 hypothetical protein [Bifidobacterium tsurumiense]
MENATYNTLHNHFAARYSTEGGINSMNASAYFKFTDAANRADVRVTDDFTSVDIYVEADRDEFVRTEYKRFSKANYRGDAALIAAVEEFIAK